MIGYRFIREALDEYEDAIEYYERAQPGLGQRFIEDVERVLALTLEFPDIGTVVPDMPLDLDVRRRVLQRFGVEIDYVVVRDELIVIAIFHCKRRPGYWRDRLESIRKK